MSCHSSNNKQWGWWH